MVKALPGDGLTPGVVLGSEVPTLGLVRTGEDLSGFGKQDPRISFVQPHMVNKYKFAKYLAKSNLLYIGWNHFAKYLAKFRSALYGHQNFVKYLAKFCSSTYGY